MVKIVCIEIYGMFIWNENMELEFRVSNLIYVYVL